MAELFDALCHRLVRRIIAAADKTQNDWADVELSLVRIIAKKERLEAENERLRGLMNDAVLDDWFCQNNENWIAEWQEVLRGEQETTSVASDDSAE